MARDNNGNRSMMSLLVGAALGAAGVYLSDKKNRDKLKDKWSQMKDQGKNKVEDLKQKGSDTLEGLQSKLGEKKDQADRDIEDAQDELNK